MKVKWIEDTDFLVGTKDKIYDVISIEKSWCRIIDDSEGAYLYPPECFDVVDRTGETRLRAEDRMRKYS